MKVSVGVLFGGPSAEHEVSIASARNVARALLDGGANVVPAFWLREGDWVLGASMRPRHDADSARRVEQAFGSLDACLPASVGHGAVALSRAVDVVFSCVHGQMGEDGVVQGLFAAVGVPVVGSAVLGSALAMDKARAKDVVRARTSVAVLASVVVDRPDWRLDQTACLQRIRRLEFPCVVKPVDAGSSVGLSRVDRVGDVAGAVDRALAVREASAAMVEVMASGEELTCAVVGNPDTGLETLPPVAIRPAAGGLFDYDAKYRPGGAEELCPAPIPPALDARIRRDAEAVYRALDSRGLARADFIVQDEVPVFLELNTMPGFTEGSLVPKSVRAAGMSLAEFVMRLVDLARAETESAQERVRVVGRG